MPEFNNKGFLSVDGYAMHEEPLNSAIFSVGNGYMGIRGSFEEFGSLRIQGAFVRGYIDEIIEVIEPFPDNIYMKKYYFDEEALKEFERQDSCVNFCDVLFARINVGGVDFYPWEGKLISFYTELNTDDGTLMREVVWDNGKGDTTRINFKRFASFYNQHIFCQKITITPINHDKTIMVSAGNDTRVKTGGQHITELIKKEFDLNTVTHKIRAVNKFKFELAVSCTVNFNGGEHITQVDDKGVLAFKCVYGKQKQYVVDKVQAIATCRDSDVEPFLLSQQILKQTGDNFDVHYKLHLQHYKSCFEDFNVKISGDAAADAALRYANYQTAISAPRFDSVHSISAKGLTGEKYNQFVWWDCEIYQLPFFIYTAPQTAKNCLMYRYNCLEQSRINAAKDGYKGAKYAFCSSVTGDERVWIYARHPFMQIHINSDVCYGLLHYFEVTADEDFIKDYGLEILLECSRFWLSRAEFIDGKYHINRVTGTDEHHPYVDNDAYTNYITQYVIKKTCELVNRYNNLPVYKKIAIDESELVLMEQLYQNIFLPMQNDGMIPQFDGYFDLSEELELEGSGTGTKFQMKQSGLYHKSQIIKQPDVLLLFTYINTQIPQADYNKNYLHYLKMCESSSSLSYPPHAIAAIDNGDQKTFHDNFINSLRVDIDDIFKTGYQGAHSGCLAGGWYALFRGVFGITCYEDYINVLPSRPYKWKDVSLTFYYKGRRINASLTKEHITFKAGISNRKENIDIKMLYKGSMFELKDSLTLNL